MTTYDEHVPVLIVGGGVVIVFRADLSALASRRAILWFIVNPTIGVTVLVPTAESGRWGPENILTEALHQILCRSSVDPL